MDREIINRIKEVQRLWNDDKLTYTQIADRLKMKNRNAVAGFITRAKSAGYEFKNRGSGRRGPREKTAPVVVTAQQPKSLPKSRAEVEDGWVEPSNLGPIGPTPPTRPENSDAYGPLLPLSFFNHTDRHCPAVIGRRGREDLYCPWLRTGRWCKAHEVQYQQPVTPRKVQYPMRPLRRTDGRHD